MCKCIIGVDAGGTKTNARLYGLDGRELYSADAGPGNLLADYDTAFANIHKTSAACLSRVSDEDRVFILVGAAGVTAGTNRRDLQHAMGGAFPSCLTEVEADGCLAVWAKLRGKDGILVISGTGSIAYGKLGKKLERAGGWGRYLGDEGSAYHIAINALREITLAHDENRPFSSCAQAILNELCTDVFGLAGFAESHSKAEIAALSRLVADAARDGDTQAAALLRNAGRCLAALAVKVRDKMGFQGIVPVAVGGSVLEKNNFVRSAFEEALGTENFSFVSDSPPAAMGAYYYYLENGQ